MRSKRNTESSRFCLAIVLVIGLIVLYNAVRQSAHYEAQLQTSYSEVRTVTAQVRLLESRETPSVIDDGHQHKVSTFVPPEVLDCTDDAFRADKAWLHQQNVIASAIESRTAIAGFHNKSDVLLSPIQWRPEYKRRRNEEMSVWFSYPHKKRVGCLERQPPLHYPGCDVVINHHYRYIWIKGTRVGSTAIREPLGWICDDDWLVPESANRTLCAEELHADESISLELAQQYWNEYFVFSFVRNPYARFASSYAYVDSLMGDCPRLVNFGKLCDSPFLMAKTCSILGCCWSGAVTHHLRHVMEQNRCLFTDNGQLAVDFIGEMENLQQDLQIVLDELNRKKPSHLPKLVILEEVLPRINAHEDHYITDLFLHNSTCLERIERNYWLDFQRLGYNRITASFE